MPPRIANPFWFRAEGATIPWSTIAEARAPLWGRLGQQGGARAAEEKSRAGRRPLDVQLRWACAEVLGVPAAPFTVWLRGPGREKPAVVTPVRARAGASEHLRFDRAMALVEVRATVRDAARPVGLVARRLGREGVAEAIAATAQRGAAGATLVLRLRCGGATMAEVIDGDVVEVRAVPLDAVIADAAWRPIERVGLPVPTPWAGTAYDGDKQGLATAAVAPVPAALARLERAGPLFGWHPATEALRAAPEWRAPDPARLVDELQRTLLPQLVRLYRAGVPNTAQRDVVIRPSVASPSVGGRESRLGARAELRPLSLLLLPATTDPFLALATGFGTGYGMRELGDGEAARQPEFLVTAPFATTPDGGGAVELAAYVPMPEPHAELVPPTGLVAARDGLVAPEPRDAPWRESVRVSWVRATPVATVARPVSSAFARYPLAPFAPAESLNEVRAAGDRRPLVIVPDAAPGHAGHERAALVDAAQPIAIGSGMRRVGYAVAQQDLFGVWSRWEDVPWQGAEPLAPAPRIVALRLDARHAGSTSCPATLELELAVEWTDRTPSSVRIAQGYFRHAAANAPLPAGLVPGGPLPAGGFARDVTLAFSGDRLVAPAGATIDHLDADGVAVVAPGPAQGTSRRYRVRLPVPTLDFAPTPYWGVQCWVQGRVVVLAAPSAWSPGAATPAVALAASPVPEVPLPPPPPPGVPMGSLPDAEGRSHVRVAWSMPAGADVRTIAVWETTETALRRAAGLPQRADPGATPGVRLAALRTAYDGLPAERRRAPFRRVCELPGSARDADVALPRGSSEIHLYTVTAVTSTGIESPWPAGTPPHLPLQAVTAPRVLRPAAPRARAVVNADGTVTVAVEVPSRVPVASVRLFATRSPEAARRAETMGPPVATMPATLAPGAVADPETGELPYVATWTSAAAGAGALAPAWDEWLLRAVAMPVPTVPELAVRGQPSPSSDVARVLVLPGAPTLAPLTAATWGSANDGVVVFTSTDAPVRVLAQGEHRLSAVAAGVALAPSGLAALAEGAVAVAGPPPPAAAGATGVPVLVRGARAAGRTPLALWFRRAVATAEAAVEVTLVDPLGRAVTRRLTVPGHVPPPPPPPAFTLVDLFTIAGRGTLATLRTDAPVMAGTAWSLEVSAARDLVVFPPRPLLRARRRWRLDELPVGASPRPTATEPIVAWRDALRPTTISVMIQPAPPFDATFVLMGPGGVRVAVVRRVGGR